MKKNYKNKIPWLTIGIKNSIKNKNILYLNYRKTPNSQKLKDYKKYKKRLNQIIRQEERQFYRQQIEKYKDDLKKSWSIIKDIINKK